MQPTPIPGFITKKETAEQFQRSHRQVTRDLADAMKVQNPKVLDHCRLRTEDGETREGTEVTPELIDELRLSGRNPVWYLRVSWLEKIYGRRGHGQRRESSSDDMLDDGAGERIVVSARPELVHVLRQQVRALEQDKQDLRDELKIKNHQIAERVEREKETNSLMRELHTLMADLQRRTLPPPTPPPVVPGAERPIEQATPVASEPVVVVSTTVADRAPSPKRPQKVAAPEKGSRPLADRRAHKSAHKHAAKKPSVGKKQSPKPDAQPPPKPKGFWFHFFSR